MKKRIFAIGAVLAVLAGPVPRPAEAQNFQVIEPEATKTISLPVGTGQLIRADAEFSSLFVANPEVADIQVKSPRLLYLTGVGVGETTLFAVDDNDNVLMSSRVRVTHNTDAMQRGFTRVAPGQSVSATSVDQSLVITGAVASPEQAADVMQVANQFVDDPARVVNRMAVAAPIQVNLQVRIAEVARNVDRRLGIRWNTIGFSSGRSLSLGLVGGRGAAGVASGYSTPVSFSGPRLNLDLVLQALAEDGLVSILAEPNLTARSGESANFLAGGEYPYAVADDDDDNNTVEIAFKEFGVGLNFIPTVLDGNRISLTVATEVSELDLSRNTLVPALSTRRAETTVDLGSGQSFAIAGLMQNSSSQNVARLPALGSIPILGALFRSNSFQRGQTELVIIVTPVIVSPTSGERIATPLDDYRPPNDFERILLGRFQGAPQRVEEVRARIGERRLQGSSGFVFQ